jgi:glycogen(starch) synthase
MRVALVGNWPPPFGGVSVHVAALAARLRERGADVRVLDIGQGDHEEPGVRPARGALRYARALARAAAEGRLVHVHTNGANRKSWLVALAGSHARRPRGPRGVLTIHSGLAPRWLAEDPAHARLAAAACAGYGQVIAVSAPIAAALAAAGVPRHRITILAAFSPTALRERAAPPRLAAFRAAHAPLFAAAVAPGPTYGADLLLPAFAAARARLRGAGLVLFGPGSADAALAAPGVLNLGELPHREALAAIEAADVFVRPTRADGDAVSVREALAFGRAVVATAVGHRPGGCLLVPADDPDALMAGLIQAVSQRVVPAPATPEGEPDPLDAIVALYASLGAAGPLPDDGRRPLRAPTL